MRAENPPSVTLAERLRQLADAFQTGDFLILQNRKGSSRYRITEITDHPSDPGDLWFVTAEFAPREA